MYFSHMPYFYSSVCKQRTLCGSNLSILLPGRHYAGVRRLTIWLRVWLFSMVQNVYSWKLWQYLFQFSWNVAASLRVRQSLQNFATRGLSGSPLFLDDLTANGFIRLCQMLQIMHRSWSQLRSTKAASTGIVWYIKKDTIGQCLSQIYKTTFRPYSQGQTVERLHKLHKVLTIINALTLSNCPTIQTPSTLLIVSLLYHIQYRKTLATSTRLFKISLWSKRHLSDQDNKLSRD